MKSFDIKTMQKKLKGVPLCEHEKFKFMCYKGISCFNRCCKNLNMFLYPYDVLQLKKNLKKTSDYLISNHLEIIVRDGNYFPDVLLRMKNNKEMSCPFLNDSGCSVYPNRPYACRTFPIEQGAIYNSSNKSVNSVIFFRTPDFCMGKYEASKWTRKTWYGNQEVEIYSEMTFQWSDIKQLFHINPWGKAGFNSAKSKMAFMSAYNIDKFREFIFESSFLKRYKIENKILKKIEEHELELLKLGFQWIKLSIWGISSDIIKKR